MTEDLKDKLMNGAAAAPPAIDAAKQAFIADPMLVELCERILDGIKTGKITSLCAIFCDPMGRVQWPAHGLQATELYLGAGIFQRSIEQMVTGSSKSRILRPGG